MAIDSGRAILLKDSSIAALAAAGSYLVWAVAGPEEDPFTLLKQRDLETGKVSQLDDGVLTTYGVGSTPSWVVYVADSAPPQLVAVRHDGGDRTVLSRSLIAPIDSRGTLLAWAEGDDATQRVVVRELESGREWVAAELPRCTESGCYRIDRVTLAEQGIVFDRGAIGQQPSLIMRRAFDGPKPTTASLPGDPQPDLVPSSTGAFYYQLRRGWTRWDFGQAQPVLTDLAHLGADAPLPLRHERGRVLLGEGLPCASALIIRGAARPFRLEAPASTPYSPKEFGPLCYQLSAVHWTAGRLVAAWALIPKLSLQAHRDVGLSGVAVAANTPR